MRLDGDGMAIFHIDPSVSSDNDNENHKLVDLEEADGDNLTSILRSMMEIAAICFPVQQTILHLPMLQIQMQFPTTQIYRG